MEIFIITFVIFALAGLGMSLGPIFNRAPIKGHCGGGGLEASKYSYAVNPNPDCCFDIDEKNNAGCGDCQCIE